MESLVEENIIDFDTITITITRKPGNNQKVVIEDLNIVICNLPGKCSFWFVLLIYEHIYLYISTYAYTLFGTLIMNQHAHRELTDSYSTNLLRDLVCNWVGLCVFPCGITLVKPVRKLYISHIQVRVLMVRNWCFQERQLVNQPGSLRLLKE